MFQTMFSLWGLVHLNLDAQTIGLLLAYVGVLSAVVQFALIAPLTKRYSEGLLLVVTLGLTGVLLALWGLSPNVPLLMVALTPLCFAIGIQNTVSQSVLSKSVSPDEIGGAFGLSSALQSIGSIVAHRGRASSPVRQNRGSDVGRVIGRERSSTCAVAVDVDEARDQRLGDGLIGWSGCGARASRGDHVTVNLDPAGHEIGMGGQQHTLGGDEHS